VFPDSLVAIKCAGVLRSGVVVKVEAPRLWIATFAGAKRPNGVRSTPGRVREGRRSALPLVQGGPGDSPSENSLQKICKIEAFRILLSPCKVTYFQQNSHPKMCRIVEVTKMQLEARTTNI
jgi:hypothetical protein